MKRFRVCKVDEDLHSGPTQSHNWQDLNSGPTHSHSMYPESDLPKTVVRCLNQGSNVVSMDFHPQNPTILLVGTDIGDIAIWEVVSREKLAHKPFRVWDYTKRRIAVQAPLSRDSTVSVNKCIWSPDGTHVGVAFYNEIIHMYHFSENVELRQHLQIDAHTGSVNDIAFANHNKQIYVITCGNDKTIKVWDAISGEIQYTFEGHETPVYSVCPHHKENIQATAKLAPELWKPANGIDMRNDTSCRGQREVDPYMIVTKNSSYVMSCSGGMVSVFKTPTFQVMKQFGPCPAVATSFAFHPTDSNITAIGMEDATIQIYNCRKDEIKGKLKGHQKRITGLAFSEVLNVLVSSGADAQLCVWVINEWEKQKSTFVHSKEGRSPSSLADTRIQFHNDEVHLLVVQDSQIAIYDASKLECLCHWAPQDPMIARISSATYSCDSLLVYASFCDGSVCVFDAEDLKPRCRIAPSAFMPSISSGNTYPLVIAAHPHEPNQFSLGMTDGGVLLIEPAESEGKWGTAPSDKGAATSNDTISK